MAWPIIVSNVSVPLLGVVDTAVVGHLSDAYYIGAVAIGAMMFNFIFHGFNCLRMGTTGPTAQALGVGENGEVRALLGRALILAGAIGGAIVLLQLPIAWFAFHAIEASAEVESFAREYFLIRVWALPAALASYAAIGWFYGLHDSRSPLVLQISVNAINICLDFLFVFGFGWGVAGVAAATLIAEYAGLGVGAWLILRRLRSLPPGGKPAAVLDAARFRRMIAINRDIFIRTLCVVSGFAVFMAQSAKLGDLTLAVNMVLYNFMHVTTYALDAYAHAVEALVGEAAGRRDRDRFRAAARAAFRLALVTAAAISAAYAAAGPAIVDLLTSIEAVRAAAGEYMIWVVISPLVCVWAFTYDGVFLGATRTRVLRDTMILSFVIYMAAMFGLRPAIGNHSLWLGLMVFLSCRAVFQAIAYPSLLRSINS